MSEYSEKGIACGWRDTHRSKRNAQTEGRHKRSAWDRYGKWYRSIAGYGVVARHHIKYTEGQGDGRGGGTSIVTSYRG